MRKRVAIHHDESNVKMAKDKDFSYVCAKHGVTPTHRQHRKYLHKHGELYRRIKEQGVMLEM